MRLFSVIVVWVLIIGSVSLYMDKRSRNAETLRGTFPEQNAAAAAEPVTFDITTTFSVEADPFALTVDNNQAGQGLIVKLGDRILMKDSENVRAGIPQATPPLGGLTAGRHEAYVQATPPGGDFSAHHAVRLRIFEGRSLVGEKTIWAGPGEQIIGVLDFELHESMIKDNHEH